MEYVYANLIIKGYKTIENVPEKLKKKVLIILADKAKKTEEDEPYGEADI